MKLDNKNVLYYYEPGLTERLAADFYELTTIDAPWISIADDTLLLMYKRNQNYFRIPAKKTKADKDLLFNFEVVKTTDYGLFLFYKYTKVTTYELKNYEHN